MERSLIFLCLFYLLGCQTEHPPASSRPPARDTVKVSASVPANPAPTPASILPPIDYDTSAWTELIRLDSSIVLDLRYATDNNFVGEQLYDCGRCFLRPAVAKALVQVHQALKKEGLALKMFDCYRPRPIQWALWKKVPDPRYVANPRKGSMHNRGTAVDLTLVKLNEEELPMGTPYDYFGKEAHTAYQQLPDDVLANRKKLHDSMKKAGFAPIRTEWWHFSKPASNGELSDMLWKCY
jgi:D-alanyl-D-alanine dipeptidase